MWLLVLPAILQVQGRLLRETSVDLRSCCRAKLFSGKENGPGRARIPAGLFSGGDPSCREHERGLGARWFAWGRGLSGSSEVESAPCGWGRSRVRVPPGQLAYGEEWAEGGGLSVNNLLLLHPCPPSP